VVEGSSMEPAFADQLAGDSQQPGLPAVAEIDRGPRVALDVFLEVHPPGQTKRLVAGPEMDPVAAPAGQRVDQPTALTRRAGGSPPYVGTADTGVLEKREDGLGRANQGEDR